MDYPYTVHSPDGKLVLQATEKTRYKRDIELQLLEAGYTIRLHGQKLTKKDIKGRFA